MSKKWHLVAYDVRDEKRLRQVAKTMEGYGERLQYSLFRCHLTDRDIERLRWDLSKIMAPEDDLLVISLCSNCLAQLRDRRPKRSWDEPPTFEVVGP